MRGRLSAAPCDWRRDQRALRAIVTGGTNHRLGILPRPFFPLADGQESPSDIKQTTVPGHPRRESISNLDGAL